MKTRQHKEDETALVSSDSDLSLNVHWEFDDLLDSQKREDMYSPGLSTVGEGSPFSVVSEDQTVGPQGLPWSPSPDDSTFYSPPEELGCVYPTATSPPADLISEDLHLATATLKAEATGSRTPLIKEELRYKIQRKRRQSGLGDLKVEIKPEGPEVLTPADEYRRSRRRASNRRAATKCREKKKAAAREMAGSFESLQQENRSLKEQVEALEADRKRLEGIIQDHALTCQISQVNTPAISHVGHYEVSATGLLVPLTTETTPPQPVAVIHGEMADPQQDPETQSLLSQLEEEGNINDIDILSFLTN